MADPASSIYNRYSDNNDPMLLFSRTPSVRRCQHTDWDLCETVRLQELQEARERAAQMEKTMRWWSECTAVWREKWSVVRDERNRAREEGQSSRTAYQQANKKIDVLRAEKREVEMELLKTRSALHKITVKHLQANKSIDTSEDSTDRIDEYVEAIPELYDVDVQTDDLINMEPLESLAEVPRNQLYAHIHARDRLQWEEKSVALQDQLENSRKMIEELEAVQKATTDEVDELRRSLREQTATEEKLKEMGLELERTRAELDELRELQKHGMNEREEQRTELQQDDSTEKS